MPPAVSILLLFLVVLHVQEQEARDLYLEPCLSEPGAKSLYVGGSQRPWVLDRESGLLSQRPWLLTLHVARGLLPAESWSDRCLPKFAPSLLSSATTVDSSLPF